MKTHNFIHTSFISFLLVTLLWGTSFNTSQAASPEGETTLRLQVEQTSPLYPGSVVAVQMFVENADQLYGLQVACQTDPTVIVGQSAEFGDFFTESIVGANQWDAETGSWLGAKSQKNPAPALVGNGLFATLNLKALAPGISIISCEPIAASRDGTPQPITAEPFTVTVLDPTGLDGIIQGKAIYQGRTTHQGIEITVSGAITQVGHTDESGQFELTQLQSGAYTIQADAPLHLPSCDSLDVSLNQVTTLGPALLAGGDVDDSGAIKINDATLIGSNFGLSGEMMDARADINADGQVNVQDLSILGGNFGKEGCQEWAAPDDLLTQIESNNTSS
jgi:hypothetical protein